MMKRLHVEVADLMINCVEKLVHVNIDPEHLMIFAIFMVYINLRTNN